MRSRVIVPVALAVPGLGLAGAGLVHPHRLSYDTAHLWFAVHLPGLVLFPLVGLALALLVSRRHDPLAWIVRVTAYIYAVFYSALDVISGIAAGYVTRELGPGVPRPPEVSLLFSIGTPVGEVGSIALLACCLTVTVDQVRRHGLAGLPAVVLMPGAWLVHIDHIFAPTGVMGMALVGMTTGYLARMLPGARGPHDRDVVGA